MDHLAVAHIHPDVTAVRAVDDQVTGLCLAEGHLPAGAALRLRGAREQDAGPPVGPSGESGAVEGRGSVASPGVRPADRGPHRRDGRRGPPGGRYGPPQVRDRRMVPAAARGPRVGRPGVLGQGLQQPPRGGQLVLDVLLVTGDLLAARLQLRQLPHGLPALLLQGALGGAQAAQLAGLAGADPVEGGGLLQEGVGPLGEHQPDGGVHPAGPVLGGGQRAQPAAHPVDPLLGAGGAVLEGRHLPAQLPGPGAGAVELLGGPLRLLVEVVDARGRRVAAGGGGGLGQGLRRRQRGGRGRQGGGQHGDPGEGGRTVLRGTAVGHHEGRTPSVQPLPPREGGR